MAAVPITELQPANSKDNSFTGSRIFSKLSKSPSLGRRHRGLPSIDVQDTEPLPDHGVYLHPTLSSSRPQIAPWESIPQRQPGAPDSSVSLHQYNEATIEPSNQIEAPVLTPDYAGNMTATQSTHLASSASSFYSRPTTSATSATKQMSFGPIVSELPLPSQIPSGAPTINYMYQQFHDLSNKRIATLNYMRKSHEGRLFWFNTVQFSKSDISRIPSYTPNRLSRRATNYFLLGLSIPAVLDVYPSPHPNNAPQMNIGLAVEFMKSLNTLLAEFESFQQLHPTDGSHVGSLSRARIPQMFKRSGTSGKQRKSSVAATSDLGAQISPPAVPETPVPGANSLMEFNFTNSNGSAVNGSATTLVNPPQSTGAAGGSAIQPPDFPTTASFPPPGPADAPNSSLLPNEGPYSHLLTPPLPFAPDFYTVFATLCDVLIDTYQRLLQIVNGPSICTPNVAELFSKTDAKVRKVMVGGIVRDFEHASRESAKREVNGVQKVVLGGLMGQ